MKVFEYDCYFLVYICQSWPLRGVAARGCMTFLESVTSHLIFSPEEKKSLVEEIVPQFPLCVEKIYHSLSLMSKTGHKVERVLYLTLDFYSPKLMMGFPLGSTSIFLVWVMRLGLLVDGWL